MIFVFCFFVLCVFFSFKKNDLVFLSPQQTLPIRGLLSILIVLHHIYRDNPDTYAPFFYLLNNVGFWIVSVFFFLSGYGLASCIKYKRNYLKSFLLKKTVGILFPVFIIELLYCLISALLSPEFKLNYVIPSFLVGESTPSSHWFVWMIFIQYILFYYSFKNGYRNGSLRFLIFTIVVILILYIIGFPSIWYKSTIFMPLGIIYYFKNNSSSLNVIKLFLYIMLAIFLLIGFYIMNCDLTIIKITGNVCISACVIYILLFMLKKRLVLSGVIFDKLGRISFEIYILHEIVLRTLSSTPLKNSMVLPTVVILVTIVISYGYKKIIDKILSKYNLE